MAMPVRPIEIMLAKIAPYIVVGYIQVLLILAVSGFVFHLPVRGSLTLLLVALGVVHRLESRARPDLLDDREQPDAGATDGAVRTVAGVSVVRPVHAVRGHAALGAMVGEIFPATHAIRIVRGVLLKGNAMTEIMPDIWPMALFTLVVVAIGAWLYRETLDQVSALVHPP